ncbi:MAG: hypothetical protein HY608_06030 [Planctomycetes bacterium]|nr:hypothetical protein [Planctomycetota bacterium]
MTQTAREREALDLRSIASFLPSSSNHLAYRAVVAAGGTPTCVPDQPIVLYGPAGNGKTHLLESLATLWAIGARARREMPGAFFGAGEPAGRIRWAIRAGTLAPLRRRLETLSWVALDDLDSWTTKPACQQELRGVLDAWTGRGVRVAFTSREHPGRLKGLQKGLASRLSQGFAVRLDPPDHDLCVALACRVLAGVSAQVRAREVREAIGEPPPSVRDLLDRLRGIRERVRGGAAVPEALREAFAPREGAVERLLRAVGEVLGTGRERIFSRGRPPGAVRARRLFYRAALELDLDADALARTGGGDERAAAAALRRAGRLAPDADEDGTFAEILARARGAVRA